MPDAAQNLFHDARMRQRALGRWENEGGSILPEKATPQFETHLMKRITWLRASVLGANDGILSIASIVSGMAAGNASRSTILLAGIAGLVAGATSMATGEYVSVSSQIDIENADLAREKYELKNNPTFEMEELAQIYVARGIELLLARQVACQLMKKDALGAHAIDELGISGVMTPKPVQAAFASAASFTCGAVLPLVVAILSPLAIMNWSIILSSLFCLVVLGMLGAKMSGVKILRPTLRMLLWGIFSLGFTTLIGVWFGIRPDSFL